MNGRRPLLKRAADDTELPRGKIGVSKAVKHRRRRKRQVREMRMQRALRLQDRLGFAGLRAVARLVAGALLAAGAAGALAQSDGGQAAEAPAGEAPTVAWLAIELTDVRTQEAFTLADFADKPVLLEAFAVWCGTCTNQQRQIAALHEEVGDAVVSVTVNTDPNETETQIVRHLDRYGFDWLYAVSPVALSRALRNDFGVSVLHPPSAPVILICPGQTERRLLRRGVKGPGDLQEQIAACPAAGGAAA